MLAVRKHRQLVKIFGEPRGGLGNVDKAVLDDRGLRVQTHGLVAGRLVTGDAVAAIGDQFLDQLGAGGLVLDQHHGRTEQALLLAHRALQSRILELPAKYTDEKEVLVLHAPRCAYREIAEFGDFVSRVPALYDAVEALRYFVLAVTLEPVGLDQPAAQRGRRLLVLAGEVVFADRPPDTVEHLERLAV